MALRPSCALWFVLVSAFFPGAPAVETTEDVVNIDLGSNGSRVQPGWIAWHVGPGGNWNHRGPFSLEVERAGFDADGFTITIGPEKGIGYRSGPGCLGARAAVIEENLFTWADRPLRVDISRLAAGRYRIVLWHNDSRGYERPPVRISVTDAAGSSRVCVSAQAQTGTTNSAEAAKSDFIVVSDGKQTIGIRTEVQEREHVYVSINAMQIIGGNAVAQAVNPTPIQNASDLSPLTSLRWHPGVNARAHRVHFGTDHATLRPVAVLEDATTFQPEGLRPATTYFWRVDEVTPNGVCEGRPWRFSTADGRASRPRPATGDTDVPRLVDLSWSSPEWISSHRIELGPAPDRLVHIASTREGRTFRPSDLALGQTVYWRVDTVFGDHVTEGSVWRFSVEPGRAKHPVPGQFAAHVSPHTVLSWQTGDTAARHSVYLGTHPEALRRLAESVAEASVPVSGLELGQTYFWRVDEVYDTGVIPGVSWSFAVADSLLVDDMEAYDMLSSGSRLADVWRDGRADSANGACVRVSDDGPGRAMLIRFAHGGESGAACSEVALHLHESQDWRLPPGCTLRMRVRGRPDNPPTRLSIVVTDTDSNSGHLTDVGSADAVSCGDWRFWQAPLAACTSGSGIDLRRVSSLTLRLEPASGSHDRLSEGSLCVDDIRVMGDGEARERALGQVQTRGITGIRGAHVSKVARDAIDAAQEDAGLVTLRTDVCIVGGGSGGSGAAIAAARAGVEVILIEREARLGGTSTQGYVSNWEPGPGCAIAREIFERLQRRPSALTASVPYERTLTRAGMRGLSFEPEQFSEVVLDMLRETRRCRVLLNTSFVTATTSRLGQRVNAITAVARDGQAYRICAGVYVDCTGGGYLCQAAGCDVMLGAEPRSRFGEPSAPEAPEKVLNAMELCYRIRPRDNPLRQPLPESAAPRRGGYAFPLPSGDRMVNPCGGLMSGMELIERGYEGAMAEAKQRVQAHWHWLQKTTFPGYEFDSYGPMLAIRESYRVVGEYVLTENDLLAGIKAQVHPDIVAIADHPMDTHGSGGGLRKVATPYGIPYRCLIPAGGWTNLMIACRGASFSHIAASSCRLSRTIIQLGHAAGLGAALAVQTHANVGEVDVSVLQKQLGMPP